MSVDYHSALIYGYDCSKIKDKFDYETLEQMQENGWDVILDPYSEEFLYIGKIISQVSCYDEARIDCLAALPQAELDLESLIKDTSKELRDKLPMHTTSIYHLCYAT